MNADDEKILKCSCEKDLPTKLIDTVIRLGRAQQYLDSILKDDIFMEMSKHDTKWHSEYDRESDILDNTRRGLSILNDNLWFLMCILRAEDDC